MADEITFDFITDSRFRTSLEADLAEMRQCDEVKAWKSVYVLAGSIIEAVLVDYLISAGQTNPDPLQMTLNDLISAAKNRGILSQRTGDLSSAIKSYRNLIHPGRALRLGETVDEEGARVAQALVSMIVRDVSARQQQDYGPTAEQLLRKFEGDSSAIGISTLLLRDAKQKEIERLLLEIVPGRYFAEIETEWPDSEILTAHTRLFRTAFSVATDEIKQKVMSRYVKVLKEDVGARVQAYGEEFFRAPDLEFLSEPDRRLVKTHLFSRLRDGVTLPLLDVTRGIGKYLLKEDLQGFLDPLVRAAIAEEGTPIGDATKALLLDESRLTPGEIDPLISLRLAQLEMFYQERNNPEAVMIVTSIKRAYSLFDDDDIPF